MEPPPQGQVRLGGQAEELRPQRTVTMRPLTLPAYGNPPPSAPKVTQVRSPWGQCDGQVQPQGGRHPAHSPRPVCVLRQRRPVVLGTGTWARGCVWKEDLLAI